jgi:hypothetical protein
VLGRELDTHCSGARSLIPLQGGAESGDAGDVIQVREYGGRAAVTAGHRVLLPVVGARELDPATEARRSDKVWDVRVP